MPGSNATMRKGDCELTPLRHFSAKFSWPLLFLIKCRHKGTPRFLRAWTPLWRGKCAFGTTRATTHVRQKSQNPHHQTRANQRVLIEYGSPASALLLILQSGPEDGVDCRDNLETFPAQRRDNGNVFLPLSATINLSKRIAACRCSERAMKVSPRSTMGDR